MNGRDEILRNMLSRSVTPDEFNFDHMVAPPVEYFLHPQDIQDLTYLANSIKYNAKIDYKYKAIDQILKNRGFVLLGRGTNRVVYRYLENNTICLKVAVDHVGCSDNPHEFINQEYLKPFVSKIFSYDPSGTIAVAERVHPISTREEFVHYANGIYDLITKWFIGKYVVNDIGSKFFMNWGIRYSTGLPVLLDYPYFYLLDISKAKCMSILEDGTICGGDIDYDDGYNFLKCTKCGRNYKAAELAKDDLRGANSNIVTEGFKKMRAKISIRKGNNVEKIIINPETKKLEDSYNKVAKVSTRTISQVMENKESSERSINQLMTAADNINRSENKVKVQTRKSKVVIVRNEENKGLKANKITNKYETEGHFKPEKKTPKKFRVNPKNNGKQEFTETHFDVSNVHISTKGNAFNHPEVSEEIKETVVENTKEVVVEDTVEVKDEITVEVSSAKDNESVVNEEGVHVEDESTEEEAIEEVEEVADETEIDNNDISEEVMSEMVEEVEPVEEDPVQEEAAAEESVETEELEEEVETPNLAKIINEAIEEETDSVVEAIDNLDVEEADKLSEEEQNMLIMQEAEKIREEQKLAAEAEEKAAKKTTKKKSSSKKFDPDFYGGATSQKKKASKKTAPAEEE